MWPNYSCRWLIVLIAWIFPALANIRAQDPKPAVPDTLDKDYAAELPRSTPLSPEEALKSFEIVPGFKLELVAAEPLVTDPIAICFDENSRMYVVEMRGYSEERNEKLSRIRLLEDTDNDGKYEKSTIFADGLLWPTAIHCWKGGVFVADAPDLFYLKDTTGDGVADEKNVVLTGFGTSNVQGLVNTMQWSLDNRLILAISSSGAILRKPEDPPSKAVTIRGRDIALNPETLEFTPITGGAQHGATWDRWGNRFVCSNSDHIQHCVLDDHVLARNPYAVAGNPRRSIAADGPQADVFRISPLEPWRIVRTRLRVNKIVPGIVEGGGRPAGYFTGATGVTLYSGDAWPEENLDLAFVGDVGSNLVHRKRLKPHGVSFLAERIDEKREFLASRDTWFRPVQFANAPDGCLYVIDMYRETIEHPASIPPILKKHLDLTSGRDRGRIYRVVPEKFTRRPSPQLGKATPQELVHLLNHANGWHRETAARLLHELDDSEAGRMLPLMTRQASRPEGRIRALHALASRYSLNKETFLTGLQDKHPRVREATVKLADESNPAPLGIRGSEVDLIRLASDPDQRVRFRVACVLALVSPDRRIPAIVEILRHDATNPDMRIALQTASPTHAGALLQQLAKEDKLLKQAEGQAFLRSILKQIGKQQDNADIAVLGLVFEQWAEEKSPLFPAALESLGVAAGSGIAERLDVATAGKTTALFQQVTTEARRTVLDAAQPLARRVAAAQQLRLANQESILEIAEQVISPTQPQEVQAAIIISLSVHENSGDTSSLLLRKYGAATPETKGRILDAVIANQYWSGDLLKWIDKGDIPAGEIDANRWRVLTEHPFGPARKLATRLASATRPSPRADVLAEYRPTLETAGDAARGKEVFKKTCATCHKLQGVGHEIGPNLAAMKNRGPEAILVNVLDPNREVNPQYLNYLLLTLDGRSLSGILTGETATSVTLKKQENATETVLRVDIENLKSTGQSLMPVGMEKQVDKQGMADLLEYLKGVE